MKSHLKPSKTLREIESEFKKLTGGWSQDTIWIAKANLFRIYQNEQMIKLLETIARKKLRTANSKWWQFWE